MATILGLETGIGTGFLTTGWPTLIMWLLITVLLVAGFGLLAWFIFMSKVYRYKIIDFERLGGAGFFPTFRDKARLVKVGDGGEEILYLRKKKQYRAAYGRKMGKNDYWYAQGQDGYWYNFVLGDLDAKMGMLDIEPIDRDVRMMHVANRKNYQQRYRKTSFMDQYGSYIFGGLLLIILIAGGWFIMDKQADMIKETNIGTQATLKTSQEMMTTSERIISKLELLVTGSGIRDAPS